MKELPLISIIVPVYNTLEYLEGCFNSISNQKYNNLEVIIIDDGSTDGSASFCDEYIKKDSRFQVVHLDNRGVSSARNVGLKIAKGKYIGFVDSDDRIVPEMYEELYNLMVKNASNMAICNQTRIINDNGILDSNLKGVYVFNRNEAINEVLLGRTFVGGPCNKLFDANICKEFIFDEDIAYGEDLLFVIKNLLKCKNVVYTSKAYYNYYIRENSACTSSFNEKTFTDHISRERILKLMQETEEKDLIELAHTAFLLCDIGLLGKIYYDKSARKTYSRILQKSLRTHFSVARIRHVTLFQKIGIVSGCISIKLYFLLFPIQLKIKQIK